jgi:hypothetical protein
MTTTTVPTRSTTTTTADKLLTCGLVAGPLYMAVYLAQAFTRENFDLTRHPASLLSNGGPGWIQTLNFVVAGLLCVAAGVGLRRTVSGRGSTWGPRLVAQYGVGLLLAAVFRADPAAGFPAGTPEDYAEISWHGMGHFVAGFVGFGGLIAACLVFAAHFRSTGQKAWARYSTVTGVLFGGSFLGLMAGAGSRPTIVAFVIAVTLGWTWLALLCLKFRR